MLRDYHSSDLEGVRRLLLNNGWAGRAEDGDRLRRVVESATRAVVAEADGSVVGFGRCLTDGTSNGYLSMVVVAASHRHQGIGRAIVEELMGGDERLTWVLRAGHPGSADFWSALGFTRSEMAFERPRRL